ncbi:translation elongation factor Ts [Corallococcus caeni]|uniref:Elongation factor Ts n=2 Tax=Corallococcus TaxID=83461 RepID=A0A3A8HV90_9BACT|nr:translation elongation factor Ts [Corallococcus exercitus]GMT99854.1 translation elongation factor Ts [Corallococcus sp. KH5-1]GMU09007.1 translation elongation factor Ts [Corallococcus sp. NO1]NOK12571.1 translation elongation factor Ts [Corallococcus exercitus]NOK35827.1 translation elongation factor Ts [Corallococcus exercitus]RKG74795.1 translation elongation factor Ts [Corallococcus exercitus]
MAEITAQMVKDLRERTNAGMMDCKKALAESGGDFAKAEEWLRKKGISKAEGKAGRVAAEGIVGTYVHGGRIGVLVEVNCETDFVARNPDFQELVKDVAMQIAAANPKFVRREEVPSEAMDKEKEIQRELLKQQGKPEAMLEKILVGKMEKYYEGVCLVDQLWVKDDKKKVGEMINERAAKIGEKVSVRRFARFEVGEGIEKKKDDLAAEVAKTLGQA